MHLLKVIDYIRTQVLPKHFDDFDDFVFCIYQYFYKEINNTKTN